MNTTPSSHSFRAGETARLEFVVTDEDGAAASISGMTAVFVMARTPGADPVASTEADPATAEAELTVPLEGLAQVTIDPEVTADFRGTYRWEFWLEDGNGDINEPAYGFCTFAPSVRVQVGSP